MSSSRERQTFFRNKNLFIFFFLLGMILRAGGKVMGTLGLFRLGAWVLCFPSLQAINLVLPPLSVIEKTPTINLLILLNCFDDTLAYC